MYRLTLAIARGSIAQAFVQSLPVGALFYIRTGSAAAGAAPQHVLAPQPFQEALVRVGLLLLNEGTHAANEAHAGSDSKAETDVCAGRQLSQLPEADLSTLIANLQAMRAASERAIGRAVERIVGRAIERAIGRAIKRAVERAGKRAVERAIAGRQARPRAHRRARYKASH